MFTSRARHEKKTGAYGIGRLSYLQSLVNEYQSSELSSSRREILANLANFAYDPLNYEYFRQLNILDLFLDCLADDQEKDPELKHFSMVGVCNSCLDKKNKEFYLSNGCVKIIIEYLFWGDNAMLIQTITTLIYLVTPASKTEITTSRIRERMTELTKSSDKRVQNLANIFIQDYCTR